MRSSRERALRLGTQALFVLFAIEVAALAAIRLPLRLQFDVFAFNDAGANLTAQYLIDHGYRPAIDFGYHYGLLGLAVARLWFKIVGRSPLSYEIAMWCVDVLVVLALARLIGSLRAGMTAVGTAAVAMPLVAWSGYQNFAHALEATLLSFALAEHARGNRRRALLLTTACVFAKPSMAYLYGLALLLLTLLQLKRERRLTVEALVRELLPAATTAVGLGFILAAAFGPRALALTILPLSGNRAYRIQGFGFFKAGRAFWSSNSVSYYVESIAGFWLVAVMLLSAAGVVAGWRIYKNHPGARRRRMGAELAASCAFLNLCFVTLFWGNQWTWSYYAFVLVIGLCAVTTLGPLWRRAVLMTALLVPLTKVSRRVALAFPSSPAATTQTEVGSGLPLSSPETSFNYDHWFRSSPTPATANLWAPPDEGREWTYVLRTIGLSKATMLTKDGCADLLSDRFSGPVSLYLFEGLSLPAEVDRKADQLDKSSLVVIPAYYSDIVRTFPELGARINGQFHPLFVGKYFTVFRRGPAGQADDPKASIPTAPVEERPRPH